MKFLEVIIPYLKNLQIANAKHKGIIYEWRLFIIGSAEALPILCVRYFR